MKKCKICAVEKTLDKFPYHTKSKGTLRAECLDCYNDKRKRRREENPEVKERENKNSLESYYRHREKRIKKVTEYQRKNKKKVYFWAQKNKKKRRKEWIKFKSKLSCIECGENHVACLDFHHTDPSQKERLISKTIYSPNILKEELKKCIVLCANCHRKHHWDEKNKEE